MEQSRLILKASRGPALATLTRLLGDLDLAEEAVQEASLRALTDWDRRMPDNAVAWLVQIGRRYAIDRLRREATATNKSEELQLLVESHSEPDEELRASVLHQHDDQLRLIFTCCHPGLSMEARVALTLKIVAGLDTDEIARAYLIPVATLQRRLQRAKQKIREARIPYELPTDSELELRLDAVLRVIYLIYNQAYTVLKGESLLDAQLSRAALNLARMLLRLIRDDPEVMGLLALLLMQHARAPARIGDDGLPVPLEAQDRGCWDRKLIAEANVLIAKSDRHWRLGPYQIQAAIAAVHNNFEKGDATDWHEILRLYDLLDRCAPSPVVTLNRAVAVARLHGPQRGLELLRPLGRDPQMSEFQYFHSARANLLAELGDNRTASAAFERALALCQNEAEHRYMERQLKQLGN